MLIVSQSGRIGGNLFIGRLYREGASYDYYFLVDERVMISHTFNADCEDTAIKRFDHLFQTHRHQLQVA